MKITIDISPANNIGLCAQVYIDGVWFKEITSEETKLHMFAGNALIIAGEDLKDESE